MKAYQIIQKFLYGPSVGVQVYIQSGTAQAVQLDRNEVAFPTATDAPHRDMLDRKLESFSINNNALTLHIAP